jgi:hypothetical protein
MLALYHHPKQSKAFRFVGLPSCFFCSPQRWQPAPQRAGPHRTYRPAADHRRLLRYQSVAPAASAPATTTKIPHLLRVSLCVSRAFLGKMIILGIEWLQQGHFSYQHSFRALRVDRQHQLWRLEPRRAVAYQKTGTCLELFAYGRPASLSCKVIVFISESGNKDRFRAYES